MHKWFVSHLDKSKTWHSPLIIKTQNALKYKKVSRSAHDKTNHYEANPAKKHHKLPFIQFLDRILTSQFRAHLGVLILDTFVCILDTFMCILKTLLIKQK